MITTTVSENFLKCVWWFNFVKFRTKPDLEQIQVPYNDTYMSLDLDRKYSNFMMNNMGL